MKTLSIKREADGKLFEVSRECNSWKIIENRGLYGRFNAVLNDPVFMWNEIDPFISWVHAYTWLKGNINNLLYRSLFSPAADLFFPTGLDFLS